MATKFYLHNATSDIPGTLPSAEQSTLTAFDNFEANQNTNRSMDKIIGTSQTSLSNSSNNSTSLRDYYVARWVSPILAQTSIAANTWTYNFAALESNANANFPVSGTNQPVYVCCYVWKPSNGTKYGNILDGNSASAYDEPSATNTEKVMHGTFSGSAVSSLTAGDAVIVFEMWFRVTQAMAVSYTQEIFYDGTTENTTENATVSNHASFIETPENIGFFYQRSVSETLGLTDAQSKLVKKSIAETLSLTDTQKKLIQKAVAETLALTDSTQKFIKQTINESLAIVDNSLKKGSKFVTDTLNLTDDADSLFIPGEGGELFQRSASDTLDLTDSVTKVVRKAVSETLDLTDTQNKLVQKNINESLTLTDDQEKKGNKFVQEVLDLIDDASRIFIPAGGGQLFQRAVNETLDLIDSVLVNVFRVPPPAIPGGGHIIPTRIREQIPSKFKRPNFVYKIKIEETLNLKDKVSSVAHHYNLIPKMFYGSEVREYLTMLDKVTIKVIRSGRKNILQRIKSALNSLDILDLGATEDSPLAIAADVSRINVHLTKTNRGTLVIQEQLQADLKKMINKMLRDYKEAGGFIDSETIKQKYEDEVTALIRVAVQESYIMGVNYVGKALKVKSLYLTGTDIERIKSETERITAVFFRNAQEYLKQWQMTERMKLMPIGFGGLFGDIAKSLEGIVKVVSSIATFSVANKATTSKLSQIPATATVDPATNVATVGKRILVFVTKRDEKVCPICQRYEGVEYFEDDPFIVNPVDDTHPNCRCRLLIKTEIDSDVLTG